jgi:hypothetical protein
VLSADGFSGDARTLDDAARAIVGSVAARGQGATGLEAFVARAEREGPAAVVLFVPVESGPWTARALAMARRRPGRVRAVVGVDGLGGARSASPLARLFLQEGPGGGTDTRALEEVHRILVQGGVPVTIVDRTTGRALGPEIVARVHRRKDRAA